MALEDTEHNLEKEDTKVSKTSKILMRALVAITVVALGALVVVLLSGCGGEEAPTPAPVPTETPAEATPVPAEPTAEPTAEPGAVDDSWDRIQAAGRIVVGTSADYPPFESYVAPGQIDGFDIALMDEIGRRLGVQVVYVDYPFDALLTAGQAGQIDIAIAAISRTPEREAVVGFSNVYLVSEGAALAQQASDITLTKLEDVARYRVGVQRNTVYKNQIQTGFVDQGLMPPENLTWYEKAEDAVYELLAGRIELVVMDSQAAQVFAEEEAVKVVGIGGGQQFYAIALPKEAAALKAKIDEVITTLINEGFIASLSERYLGTPLVLPTPTPGPTSAPVPPPSCVNNMALVQHLTKETEMKPGQAFTKGWQVRNTGTCPWTTSYRLVFASGAKMAGEPAAVAREVKAGETYDWQVPLVAPVNPGTYEGIWQMVDAQGTPLGERLKVNITVKGGPTPTPKPSQTPSAYVEFKEKDNRYQIKVGESVTLIWSTENVKEVYFYSQYEDWRQGGVPGDGSSKETPQTTTTYYLKVINRDNTVYIPEIKITVEAAPEKPKITQFSVDPAGQITQGQSVAIRWQVDGKVDSVTLTANGQELSRASKGTITHTPLGVGQWNYHLKAVGPGGTNEGDRTITVVPVVDPITPEPPPPDPVIYAFDVSPNQIEVGNCVNVSWSVGGGAASVRVLRDGSPYWDPPDLQGQFCDTLDEARPYTYQLLARGRDKDVPSQKITVSVTEAPPQNPLANTSWVVRSLQDGAYAIVPDAPPTASFGADGTITGAGACMTYGGSYRAEGNSISISVGATSALNCSEFPDIEARMAQDQAFLDLLPMATNFSLDGNQLLILDPGGMRLMELR
jgi:polar amino acid transport system substrate-binding protein